jgi:hypothetical protein
MPMLCIFVRPVVSLLYTFGIAPDRVYNLSNKEQLGNLTNREWFIELCIGSFMQSNQQDSGQCPQHVSISEARQIVTDELHTSLELRQTDGKPLCDCGPHRASTSCGQASSPN